MFLRVPAMQKRAWKTVNISSDSLSAPPMLLHYVASKGAIIAMTRAMARELGEYGIAVNALAPGFTMSEAGRELAPERVAAMAVQARAFKREQLPEDLVGPLLFLTTADSAFVTGQTYLVDGGSTMQ